VAGIRAETPITIAPRLRNVPSFDGVRGIGVLMVIAVHAAPLKVESFSSILDVFLALSAFLVTTLLLEEGQRSGTVSVRRFLAKRAWRLLPALYVTLAVVTAVAAVLFAVAGDDADLQGFTFGGFLTQEILPAGLYVYNLVNPLGYPNQGVALYQMWSLSLEQQFYVLVAFLALLMVTRRWITQMAVLMAVLAVGIQIARATGHFGPLNFWLQRPDALMLGVVAAVINSRIPETPTARQRQLFTVGAWVGAAMIIVLMTLSISPLQKFGWPYVPFLPEVNETLSPQQAFEVAMAELSTGNFWVKWAFTITNWAMVPVLICMVRTPRWLPGRALSIRPVRAVGRMSYSLYLIHTLPILLFVLPIPDGNLPARILVAWITAFVFAWPLYQFVEKRSMARKDRVDTGKLTAA
jgi:peptidoglycan/LPS O-acetylase OafA/YrhL